MYKSFKQYTTKQNKTQTLQTKMQPNIINTCVNNDNNQNAQVHTKKKKQTNTKTKQNSDKQTKHTSKQENAKALTKRVELKLEI
jgi:hypothetical protein